MIEAVLSWRDDVNGVVHQAHYVPSPNCDERPPGIVIDLLVIHFISLPPGHFGGDTIDRLFTNTLDETIDHSLQGLGGLRVSAHFLIRRDGSLTQYVPCQLRAWHAGQSSWKGRSRCNDFSIGIELEGDLDHVFEEAQYATLEKLIALIKARHPIVDVVGHEHIAPGRKPDPGPGFDWRRVS